MGELKKTNEILLLPYPKSEEDKKWNYLKEKLRRKKEKYLNGLQKFGTIQEAMNYAGIKNRSSLTDYRRSDPEFFARENKIFDETESEVIDLAVKNLYRLIKKGDMRAISYFLDRRASKFKPKSDVDNKLTIPELKKIEVEIYGNNAIKHIEIESDKCIPAEL